MDINEYTHHRKIKFIAADTRGLTGFSFCDFGTDFQVTDVDGVAPLTGMIAAISQDKEGAVTCLDESRHFLQEGDYVAFSEILGMTPLNHASPMPVKPLGPYTFSIGDTTQFPAYERGGIFKQVKMPIHMQFKTIKDTLASPPFMVSDFAKFDRPIQLHCAYYALSMFLKNYSRVPVPCCEDDANTFLNLAQRIAKEWNVELDEKLINLFATQAAGDLAPMAAVLGGLVAQEVLKACTGKLTPIHQYFYFDAFEAIPTSFSRTKEECELKGTRYDGQIAVFGKTFQEKLMKNKVFLVGAGAIGCEMLKNWAMMGISTDSTKEGHVYVTDMDSIEKSNLNRQFLFRSNDVSKLKSETAANAVLKMNPHMRIQSFTDRVGPDSEAIFNDVFWGRMDIVVNALDNVEARRYVDRRCVLFRKPLFDSGTMGTQGSTQVVIPHLTESYGSSQDPPEKSIPLCTLKNFPNQIEHTIQWARDLFEGIFRHQAEHTNLYLSSPQQFKETLKQQSNASEILDIVRSCLVEDFPKHFDDCLVWARFQFEHHFVNNIKQLLFNFPKDSVTSTGALFWSGPKRAPDIISFDIEQPWHCEFIWYAALLRAYNYSITTPTTLDVTYIKKTLQNVHVPAFQPKQGVKIQVNENEAPTNTNTSNLATLDPEEFEKLLKQLPDPMKLANFKMQPSVFEKDDDTNHHISWITSCSNLRAITYSIAPADRSKTKWIAGKIIPAIATTTALVTGLVCLELYKYVDPKSRLEQYKNGFLSLAQPLLTFSEPIAAPKMTYNQTHTFTLWDRFEFSDQPLMSLLEAFETKHQLEITMMSCGVSMLYSFFMPAKKKEERKKMMISDVYTSVTKKTIPSHLHALVLEVCCNDDQGNDVEVPYILLKLLK
ncbi:hypothetical protein HMI55_000123 [Coelomomyces lativittatus]|nr:hypothetical protein HMI55_000123 [Coelomomyces lativittatus]